MKSVCFFMGVGLSLLSMEVQASGYKINTGELAPFSYRSAETKELKGVVHDVLMEIQKRLGTQVKPKLLPWPRAIQDSTGNKVVTFPLARVPYREDKYHWVGPIAVDHHIFAVKGGYKGAFTRLSQLKNLKVGVLKDAPPHRFLKKEGFGKIKTVTRTSLLSNMLVQNRIDSWYDLKAIIDFNMRLAGYEADRVKTAYNHEIIRLYIGFSLDLKDEALRWQEQFEKMMGDDSYNGILGEYKFSNQADSF